MCRHSSNLTYQRIRSQIQESNVWLMLSKSTKSVALTLRLCHSHLYFFIQTLITLKLTNNRIGDSGATDLAEALERYMVKPFCYTYLFITFLFLTQMIKELDLRQNQIKDRGAEKLVNAIRYHTVKFFSCCLPFDSTFKFHSDIHQT
jgi:hypothetical protein